MRMLAPNSSVNRMIDSVTQTRGRYHMSRRCFKANNLIVCRVTVGVHIRIHIIHTYMFIYIYILYMIEIPVKTSCQISCLSFVYNCNTSTTYVPVEPAFFPWTSFIQTVWNQPSQFPSKIIELSMEWSAREHNKSRANKALFILPGAAQTHRSFVVLS